MLTQMLKVSLIASVGIGAAVPAAYAQSEDFQGGGGNGNSSSNDDAAGALLGLLIGGMIAAGAEENAQKKAKNKAQPNKQNKNTANANKPKKPVPDSPEKAQNRQIQTALNYFGFDVGTADGVMGNRSSNAIKDFQKLYGFPETGALTEAERGILFDAYENAFDSSYGNAGGNKMATSVRSFVLGDSVRAASAKIPAAAIVASSAGNTGSPALEAAPVENTATAGSPALAAFATAAAAANASSGSPQLEPLNQVIVQTAAPDNSLAGNMDLSPFVDPNTGATVFTSDINQEQALQFFINTNAPG